MCRLNIVPPVQTVTGVTVDLLLTHDSNWFINFHEQQTKLCASYSDIPVFDFRSEYRPCGHKILHFSRFFQPNFGKVISAFDLLTQCSRIIFDKLIVA
jgi:hypothetical protein